MNRFRWPPWDTRPRDRRLLEDVILAHHAARPPPRSVLFVGVARGQRDYPSLFRGHRFITADLDPASARYGSSQGHHIACASELDRCLDAASFDLAVMNGVIGWGLNDAAVADRAMGGLHRLLRPGGELVLGWNERPGRRPFDPLALPAMRRFEACVFEPLGSGLVDVPGWRRHRYAFFRRPADGAPVAATGIAPED